MKTAFVLNMICLGEIVLAANVSDDMATEMRFTPPQFSGQGASK